MDKFTLNHLMEYIKRHVHDSDKLEFTSFAANILSNPDDLEYYMREGWQRLYDRFWDETND